jgi:hypothetical protein
VRNHKTARFYITDLFFFLEGIQFQDMEELCRPQVSTAELDSSYIEVDSWVKIFEVFLSSFLRMLMRFGDPVGHKCE